MGLGGHSMTAFFSEKDNTGRRHGGTSQCRALFVAGQHGQPWPLPLHMPPCPQHGHQGLLHLPTSCQTGREAKCVAPPAAVGTTIFDPESLLLEHMLFRSRMKLKMGNLKPWQLLPLGVTHVEGKDDGKVIEGDCGLLSVEGGLHFNN